MATTFTEGVQASLAPWADADGNWQAFNAALGAMFEDVYGIVVAQGSPDDPADYTAGWSTLLDPTACPDQYLPYVASFLGVQIPSGTDPATARAIILAEKNFQTGTPGAVIAAAQLWLTGTQSVVLEERTAADGSSDAYHFILIARPEEAQTTNIVPNPSFEHDTLGASPAGWSDLSGWATSVVQNSWAAKGSQSLRLTFTTGYTGTGTAVIGTFNSRGAFPVVAGQQIAVSAVVNVYSVVGTVELYLQGSFFPASGGGIGIATNIVSGPGVQTLSALMTVPTGMINANFTVEAVNVGGGGSTTIDFALDDVLVAMNVPSILDYFDGDSLGCSWSGTPGDSSSATSLQPLIDAVDAVKPAGVQWTLVLADAFTWSEAIHNWNADTMTWNAAASIQP